MKLSTNSMSVVFTGWFGFWLFLTVYIIIESVMYLQGHDTLFWQHKTDAEIQLQQKQIEKTTDA